VYLICVVVLMMIEIDLIMLFNFSWIFNVI
jgi:hypothetical protein